MYLRGYLVLLWYAPVMVAGGIGGGRRRCAVYSTDLTDAEWALIRPCFTRLAHKTRSTRRHDRRTIVNAILYITRTGCRWELLPTDFPPQKTVYDYFRQWQRDGRWDEAHDRLRAAVRAQAGKAATPTAAILDSQSVKTTEKGGRAATTPARR
jgi:transposase